MNMDAVFVWIHDRNHLIVTNSRVYGSEIIDIQFGKAWSPNRNHYAIFPTENIFIDEDKERCLSSREMEDENIPECLDDFLDSRLNCTLPWRSKNSSQDLPLCSHPWEYDRYIQNFNRRPSDPVSMRNIAKCSPGCSRYAYSTKVYKQWVDKSEPGVLELKFFYHQFEVPVREHVYAYDRWNLISDIGGYLGLLLGYSILAFYDTLILILRFMRKLLAKGKLAMKPPKTKLQLTME